MTKDMTARGIEVVHKEHEQMRICPKCGSRNTCMTLQWLYSWIEKKTGEHVAGDMIHYKCKDCNNRYVGCFKFPKDYAKQFKDVAYKEK